MRAGQSGRVAILWNQTEIDGLEGAPLSSLVIGAAWSWRGQKRFLAEIGEQVQEKAGGAVTCLARTLGHHMRLTEQSEDASGAVVLTNGAQEFTATLFPHSGESAPMLVFEGECPERDQDFWISEIVEMVRQSDDAVLADETVIAFPVRSKPALSMDDPDHLSAVAAGNWAD